MRPATGPIQGDARVATLDVIRGTALFGILLMNITMFGLPMSYSDPTVWGGSTGPNLWAWTIATIGFEGTQRGLFSILFGAGLVLLSSRLEAKHPNAADIFYRRSLWLVVFGIIHSYLLLWTGEILYFYGLTALFVYVMRHLRPRALLAIAIAGFLFGAGWNVIDSYRAERKHDKAQVAQAILTAGGKLSEDAQDDLDAWKELEKHAKPDEKKLARDLEAHRGSYTDVVAFQAPQNADYETWFAYRYFFDIFSMLLVGMALYKWGVLTLERPSSLYWTLVLVGYAVGLSVNYYEWRVIVDGQFSVLAFMRAAWTYDLGRLAMTAGHLGALLLFCRSGWFPWLRRSLAAVGRLALSNYLTHSIVCAIVFYGFGFGLYGRLERYQLYYVVVSIWVFQLIASPIWLRYYRFGPFEWLWRWLTYLEKPPMRVSGRPI